jgi:hypothetical protein
MERKFTGVLIEFLVFSKILTIYIAQRTKPSDYTTLGRKQAVKTESNHKQNNLQLKTGRMGGVAEAKLNGLPSLGHQDIDFQAIEIEYRKP